MSAAPTGQIAHLSSRPAPSRGLLARLVRRERGLPADARTLLQPLARGEASRLSRRARTSAWGVVPYELWVAPDGLVWRPRGPELGRVQPVHRSARVEDVLCAESTLIPWHAIAEARVERDTSGLERLELTLADGRTTGVVWEPREGGRPAPAARTALVAALATRCPGVR